jgi:hypothetical protein
MGLPNVEELDHCPLTPECAARKLFRTNGKLYSYNKMSNKFVEHTCNATGTESVLPIVVYTSEWKNNRTLRTRYTGPFRSKASALKPPPDGGKQRRMTKNEKTVEWTLVKIRYDNPDWKELED